jgi:two-component system, sensor histidine kinase RegB
MSTAPQPVSTSFGIRTRTLILLRWIAVVGQSAAILIVTFGLHFSLPLAASLAVISASAWLNIFLGITLTSGRFSSPRYTLAQLVFDLTQLTLLLGLTGGLANPFIILLGVPVVVAITALSLRSALFLAALTLLATALLNAFALPLPWTEGLRPNLPDLFVLGQFSALVTATAFIAIYVWRVSMEGRRMQAALIATEAVLAKEAKLSALGGLAAAVAHELGTPLGTIALVAKEMVHALPKDSALLEDAHLMVEQAGRCRNIISKLSSHGAENDPIHARHTLSDLLEEIATPLRKSGTNITTAAHEKGGRENDPVPVLRRQPEIMHALGAFSDNAADFAQNKVEICGFWDENWIEIVISDDGEGFSETIREKLGEPYITTRAGGDTHGHGGMGLGVFIAKTLIERTGGVIKLGKSDKLGGAMVRVIWPRLSVETSSTI